MDFNNTQIAFQSKSDNDLNRAYWLFKIIGYPTIVKMGKGMTNFAIKTKLPIEGIIRKTIFKQFCGGTTINDCEQTTKELFKFKIGTILDYSVEGKTSNEDFEKTTKEIIDTILKAKGNEAIPFAVFKVTGISRFGLLEKANNINSILGENENEELNEVIQRIDRICKAGFENNVPVFIDAEESWIQEPLDQMTLDRMRIYNKENAIVFNTYQLYRSDKLKDLKQDIETAKNEGFILGAKIVRGAYVEKEAKYAQEHNSTSPIHKNKEGSDADFNEALKSCMDNINQVSLCVASHNEESCLLLTQLLAEKNIPYSHPHICVSQLYGMGDHITYNMASLGINCTKYIPFGPLVDVVPYLIRRAQENGSVNGQMGRELKLLQTEKRRRGI